jgi:hypothetical protein
MIADVRFRFPRASARVPAVYHRSAGKIRQRDPSNLLEHNSCAATALVSWQAGSNVPITKDFQHAFFKSRFRPNPPRERAASIFTENALNNILHVFYAQTASTFAEYARY